MASGMHAWRVANSTQSEAFRWRAKFSRSCCEECRQLLIHRSNADPPARQQKEYRTTMDQVSRTRQSLQVERILERALFSSRWLMAPFYIGLAGSLLLLLIKFLQQTIALFAHVLSADSEEVTIAILSLIDLSLMGNLLLMVIFAGYESFISRLDLGADDDRPQWMGRIGFGDLKIKLMTSIVAISAIQVLESFMNITGLSDRELAWSVGLHLAFILSAVMLAVMDRLGSRSGVAGRH